MPSNVENFRLERLGIVWQWSDARGKKATFAGGQKATCAGRIGPKSDGSDVGRG